MALVKTTQEIEKMREGGALLSRALQAAIDVAKPGVTMKELDDIATRVIEEGGGKPSFKGYKGGGPKPFPSTLCVSRNNEIVHGVGDRTEVLNEGDIVGLDIGLWMHGLCTDMAVTIPIGSVSKERLALLRTTRNALHAGIDAAQNGKMIQDISGAIEDSVDQKKYGIVKALVGHGVGHEVHEYPHIPNYRTQKFQQVKLQEGMCIALEPMITTGSDDIETSKDGWTIQTVDGSDAAHFEVTIAITENGPEIITPEPTVNI